MVHVKNVYLSGIFCKLQWYVCFSGVGVSVVSCKHVCFSFFQFKMILKKNISRGQRDRQQRGVTHKQDSHDVAISSHSHIHVLLRPVGNMPSYAPPYSCFV